MARFNFGGVVMILTRVRQKIISVERGRPALVGVGEDVGESLVEEVDCSVDGAGQFLFKGDAPVQRARFAKSTLIIDEGGEQRWTLWSDAVWPVICVVANAGQRFLKVLELRVIVVKADACGDFCIGMCSGRVDDSDAWRKERTANNLVPIKAKTRLDQEAIKQACVPVIFKVGAGFYVVARELRRDLEYALAQKSSIFAEIIHRHAKNYLAEVDVVE